MTMIRGIRWMGITALILFSAVSAQAHRVTVFAWVEGDMVHTESRFGGGKPVIKGKIQVFDVQSNQILLEGTTDEQGKFSFQAPKKTRMRIELHAGMGHKNHWIVKETEFGISLSAGSPETSTSADSASISRETDGTDPPIREVLEKVLDEKFAPVKRQLAELQQPQITLEDVLGGIGYIFGLVGVGMYFHYRKKERHDRL
ncbi:MAG: hypothetical protein JRJ54_08165 [Deltaproteobacteria bacterium]|nr:hypothetical protein [Deltaproteobacteria bacterium]